jgi:hypothetical protein
MKMHGCYTAVSAQSVKVKTAIIQLIDSAKQAFCENDMSKTIVILEQTGQIYPTDSMVVSTSRHWPVYMWQKMNGVT